MDPFRPEPEDTRLITRPQPVQPVYPAMTEAELRQAFEAEREARLHAELLLAEKEELLARSELMMREIDHRMRNSLQIAAGALQYQARRMPDPLAAKALKEAQQRISAIAAVHEQLSQVSGSDLVDMQAFLANLCNRLASNRPDSVSGISLDVDRLMLHASHAAKIGLLVCELVANSFKHAFPDGTNGGIDVSLTSAGEKVLLTVADTGIGLPAGFKVDDGKGLGMQLIRSVLNQFGGTMAAGSQAGARFEIEIALARLGV